MTEQARFHFDYVCGDTGLIDEQAELKWFIENCCSINDLKKNWETVCDKLNELHKENEQLKKENKDLKTSQEYWREKCLSKYPYNKLYHKPPIWFTQSAKLTDKQANEIAEAINQSLKERRTTNE